VDAPKSEAQTNHPDETTVPKDHKNKNVLPKPVVAGAGVNPNDGKPTEVVGFVVATVEPTQQQTIIERIVPKIHHARTSCAKSTKSKPCGRCCRGCGHCHRGGQTAKPAEAWQG
jgi:hypothetical protein